MSLRTVLISLQALLCNPEPSDPQDAVVAGQLLSHPKIFSHIAKQWTRLFASGPTKPFEDKEFDDKVATLINMGVKKGEAVSVLSNHNLSIQHAVERYFS
uniref:Putative ubiquitin-conjugating enzyme E2 21 (Trinotate prediction) n=1 Tax=Myxobolus squamalis TaxID=59785 RepID=A0A6B2G2K9_MYXSQ